MMWELRNLKRNNESLNVNAVTYDAIDQGIYDADNMDFSRDKESTIAASNISYSEDVGTQTQISSKFDEWVNEIGKLTKELLLVATRLWIWV